jgi:hypothetical protein
MPDPLDGLDRKSLLALRRKINERLHEIEEDKHAETVSGMALPPGWGENDGQTDGDDDA